MAAESARRRRRRRQPLAALAVLLHVVALQVGGDVVAELSDDYFDAALRDYEHAVVLFHSERCRHCSEFMPTFRLAADELVRNEPPVHAATLNCDGGGARVCRQAAVDHLPSVKIFRRGVLYDEYDGARTVAAVVAYMRRLVGIASDELAPEVVGDVAHTKSNRVVVLAVLPPFGALRESYFSLPAHLSKDIRFAHVTLDEDAIVQHNLTYGVTLYHPTHMRNAFEPWSYSYDEVQDDLLEFVLTRRRGLVGMRDARHVDDFAPPLVIAYFRYDLRLRPKMFAYWRNRIIKVAVDHRAHLDFAISPIDDFHNEFAKFGVALPPEPRKDAPLVLAILADNSKYLMEGVFTADAFDAFLRGVLNGTVEPHVKSQPVPSDVWQPGVVRTVVAKNFRQEVWHNGKDVLVEFYAPWCASCKPLEDVLDHVAKTLMEEDVVVCKMDATENDIPARFDVARLPAAYFVPADTKDEVLPYDGGATVREVLAFVCAHASVAVRACAAGKDEL